MKILYARKKSIKKLCQWPDLITDHHPVSVISFVHVSCVGPPIHRQKQLTIWHPVDNNFLAGVIQLNLENKKKDKIFSFYVWA